MVALSDAWQEGAQQMNDQKRLEFANDPINLLAVDGPTNVSKRDGDAATWLPPNKFSVATMPPGKPPSRPNTGSG
ncbi:GmrSD restriction endonuclease domain-containing protein [Paeniglutamicibacter kerguelensis]|uniref:GmrSD restriction endonuclease domain-containing protein n=1 Tax=Paeniglutamicibacter kerguelensis TaxID=254788 RepID=UPI00362391AB